MQLKVIARIRSDFSSKFGIPRQSGLVDELEAAVVFEPGFREPEALRGIEGYSHLWLIWQFSECADKGWSPTVRPPRLGGNVRMGVLRVARRSGRIQLGFPAFGCSGLITPRARAAFCVWRAQTCWTARRYTISSRICPMSMPTLRQAEALPCNKKRAR